MPIYNIDSNNFQEEVIEYSEMPVVVDFWGDHCGPCKIMDTVINELAEERNDIKICKCKIDENKDLAKKYSVLSKPTFLFFVNGEEKKYAVGVKTKEDIINIIESL